MKIKSASFGELEIDPETILTFRDGMVGFEDNKEFKLLHSEDYPGLKWLQSINEAALAFSVMDPAQVGYDFNITLSDEEAEILGAESSEQLLILVQVYEDKSDAQDEQQPTVKADRELKVNWRSPIILNITNRQCLQKVLADIKKVTHIYAS